MKTVVGLFDDYNKAENVVRELVDAGFSRENISLVANDAHGQFGSTYGSAQTGTAATAGDHPHASGAATGAVGGAVIGGLGGLVLGMGLLAIPGIGPVLAACRSLQA